MYGAESRFVTHAQVRDGQLPLRGEVIQKDGKGRFIYIVWRDDVGVVSRRAKIYVEPVDQAAVDSGHPIEILLPGKAKDGLPCCSTVKPLPGLATRPILAPHVTPRPSATRPAGRPNGARTRR